MQKKTRRDAREAEGAPLLREYRVKSLIEGSNPSLSARYAKRPLVGRFAYLAERWWWTSQGDSARPAPHPLGHRLRRCSLWPPCPRATKWSGTILDSRRLAPQRLARRSVGSPPGPLWGVLCIWRSRGGPYVLRQAAQKAQVPMGRPAEPTVVSRRQSACPTARPGAHRTQAPWPDGDRATASSRRGSCGEKKVGQAALSARLATAA